MQVLQRTLTKQVTVTGEWKVTRMLYYKRTALEPIFFLTFFHYLTYHCGPSYSLRSSIGPILSESIQPLTLHYIQAHLILTTFPHYTSFGPAPGNHSTCISPNSPKYTTFCPSRYAWYSVTPASTHLFAKA